MPSQQSAQPTRDLLQFYFNIMMLCVKQCVTYHTADLLLFWRFNRFNVDAPLRSNKDECVKLKI